MLRYSVKTTGSCWAISSAEAMSDRVCIASHGNKHVELSADDILSCCTDCGDGCDGGYLLKAWKYFASTGVVTGGRYGTKWPHLNVNTNVNLAIRFLTTVTKPTCIIPGYRHCVALFRLGNTSYSILESVSGMQKDIMRYGPVVGVFEVFQDFFLYKSGIYEYTAGGFAGIHAVKILGWGVENGTEYWTVANSWNTDWGENGFFRIRRGTNECGIEEIVVAGRV
uniref:Pept_C1 domain-containing protein n=1 Tax=Angiostrongylus cantonensis TaxID=6313 RepID=A0A0K0CX24_ANGCA